MTTSGTKEWATSNVNFITGCSHDCLYCYAKRMAIRFKRRTEENWKLMMMDPAKVSKNYRKRKGRIMFPTSHDLTCEYLNFTMKVLQKMLKSKNEVLITTKPHREVIREICDSELIQPYKDQIQFRFTITSPYNPDMSIWEPGAPNLDERIECLIYAHSKGFKTSISIEPYLADPLNLIKMVEPYTTETIWIGLMNKVMLPKIGRELYKAEKMDELYSPDFIQTHQQSWLDAGNGKIRFKDSIQNLLKITLMGETREMSNAKS